MFYFGQTATYLPYLLLVITYFVGVLGYTSGFMFKGNAPSEEPQKHVQLQENDLTGDSPATFHISEFYKRENFAQEAAEIVPVHFQVLISGLSYLENPFPRFDSHMHIPFLRPPPTC